MSEQQEEDTRPVSVQFKSIMDAASDENLDNPVTYSDSLPDGHLSRSSLKGITEPARKSKSSSWFSGNKQKDEKEEEEPHVEITGERKFTTQEPVYDPVDDGATSEPPAPDKKKKFPSLKKGFQKRLGLGKYATMPAKVASDAAAAATAAAAAPLPRSVYFGTPVQFQPSADETPLILLGILEYLFVRESYLEEGIFRIAGSALRTQELQRKCEIAGPEILSEAVLLSEPDPHNVTSLLKVWLNNLPEPLIPMDQFLLLIEANKTQDIDTKQSQFATHVSCLPQKNRLCLKHILFFACIVIDHSEQNKMKLSNVASVLAPTIMRTANSRDFMQYFGPAAGCLVFMLNNYIEIFGQYTPLSFMRNHVGTQRSQSCMSIDLSQPFSHPKR